MANRYLQDEDKRRKEALAETGLNEEDYRLYAPSAEEHPAPVEPPAGIDPTARPGPGMEAADLRLPLPTPAPAPLVDANEADVQSAQRASLMAELSKRLTQNKAKAHDEKLSNELYHTFAGTPIPDSKPDEMAPWKQALIASKLGAAEKPVKGVAGIGEMTPIKQMYKQHYPNSPVSDEVLLGMADDAVMKMPTMTGAVTNQALSRDKFDASNEHFAQKYAEDVRQFGVNEALKRLAAEQRQQGLALQENAQISVQGRFDQTQMANLSKVSKDYAPLVNSLKEIEKRAPGLTSGTVPNGYRLDDWERVKTDLPFGVGKRFTEPQTVALRTAIQNLQTLILQSRSGQTVTEPERQNFLKMFSDAIAAGPQAQAAALQIFKHEIGSKMGAAQAGFYVNNPAAFEKYQRYSGGASFRDPIFADMFGDDGDAPPRPEMPSVLNPPAVEPGREASSSLGDEEAPLPQAAAPSPAPAAPVLKRVPQGPAAPKSLTPGALIRRKDGSVWRVDADGVGATMIKPAGQ